VMWKSLLYVHGEFSYESPGRRILKLGLHLQKKRGISNAWFLLGHPAQL